jgi:uncharacterized protein
MDRIDKLLLEKIADLHGVPQGAYNIRKNGKLLSRETTEDINILSKKDKDGIDIVIKPGTKNKSVHIPVILNASGMQDEVYNDFYVGDNCDVLIVAGCGVHNSGDKMSSHNGIHTFHVGNNSHVRYVEKHFGMGKKSAERNLDPVTVAYIGKNSKLEMETVQLGGVTKSTRTTSAVVGEKSTFIVKESLLTQGNEQVKTQFDVNLKGKNSKVDVVSRSVAQGKSRQEFVSNVEGNNECFGHVECDGILSDKSQIISTPRIIANHKDAMLTHEASIGKISEQQQIKLMTLGLTKEQAEEKIIQGFLQ